MITFPDIETVAVTHLRSILDTLSPPVACGVQLADDHETFVQIRSVPGRGRRPDIVTAVFRLLVTAWAKTDADAAALEMTAHAAVHEMRGTQTGTTVYRVDDVDAGDTDPDPTTNQTRKTFTVDVLVRGTTE